MFLWTTASGLPRPDRTKRRGAGTKHTTNRNTLLLKSFCVTRKKSCWWTLINRLHSFRHYNTKCRETGLRHHVCITMMPIMKGLNITVIVSIPVCCDTPCINKYAKISFCKMFNHLNQHNLHQLQSWLLLTNCCTLYKTLIVQNGMNTHSFFKYSLM